MKQCPSCGGNCGGTKKTGCLYRSDGSLIMDNIKRVRELEAENAALKVDAARYNYLIESKLTWFASIGNYWRTKAEIDAAVDAARGEK